MSWLFLISFLLSSPFLPFLLGAGGERSPVWGREGQLASPALSPGVPWPGPPGAPPAASAAWAGAAASPPPSSPSSLPFPP
eukprot:1348695-Lingulodinium_polyedra.AAC.1